MTFMFFGTFQTACTVSLTQKTPGEGLRGEKFCEPGGVTERGEANQILLW